MPVSVPATAQSADAVTAGSLGFVEPLVGALDEIESPSCRSLRARDADADRDADAVVLEDEAVLAAIFSRRLSASAARPFEVGLGQDDRELFAAVARETSSRRMRACTMRASSFSTKSPARWPWTSLILLK